MLTSRAPVGAVAIAMKEMCTNQGFKSIIPKKEIGTEFIYCFLKANKALLDSHSSGTTFMEISGNVLKEIPAFMPKNDSLKQFTTVCNPIFEQQRINESEICKLLTLKEMLISMISSH